MADGPLDYPIPQFRFEVDFGGDEEVSFQEVSGLDTELQSIDYRVGDSPNDSVLKIPGMTQYTNVTFKRGIYHEDNELYDWLLEVMEGQNTADHPDLKRDIIISLKDSEDEIVMTWTLTNAFPVKLTGTALNAQANELAIETLEVTHEGLVQALP